MADIDRELEQNVSSTVEFRCPCCTIVPMNTFGSLCQPCNSYIGKLIARIKEESQAITLDEDTDDERTYDFVRVSAIDNIAKEIRGEGHESRIM